MPLELFEVIEWSLRQRHGNKLLSRLTVQDYHIRAVFALFVEQKVDRALYS